MNRKPGSGMHVADLLTDPHARLSVTLVLSLALWAPFGLAAMRSELDVASAGARYLVAFLGCRLAVSGITHLTASYRAMAHVEAVDLTDPSPPIGRRAEDHVS